MAALRQALERNLRQIEKLRYLNAFVTEADDYALKLWNESAQRRAEGADYGDLDGVTFAVKDNLCVKGMTTTCASKFLKDYTSPYTATAVECLLDKGCVLVGKTNLDEFAMGAGSVCSHFGAVRHPKASTVEVEGGRSGKEEEEEEEEENDSTLISGGSSGGSAVAVATGMCHFSLGSDTGGSVRIPASFCGVVGLKPSYGRVSRYGLIPLASSMDTVGVFAPDVATSALVLDTIAGWDVKDATSSRVPHIACSPGLAEIEPANVLPGCRIGVIKDFAEYLECPEYEGVVSEVVERCRSHGATVTEVELPHLRYGVPAYYAICVSEAASNMAKYSGLLYGHTEGGPAESANQKFARNRMEGLGPVVQHRIIAGTYFLSYRGRQYFEKAARMRRLIFEDFKAAFDGKVDILLSPTTIGPAPPRGKFLSLGPVESNVYDTFTTPVSLSGLPAISLPAGYSKEGLPLGLQLVAWQLQERKLLRVATALQCILD